MSQIVISGAVAGALRELRLLDVGCERLVFGIRARGDGAVLAASGDELDELDELIGFVAAEANHKPSRRRRQRLDATFDALGTSAQAAGPLVIDGPPQPERPYGLGKAGHDRP